MEAELLLDLVGKDTTTFVEVLQLRSVEQLSFSASTFELKVEQVVAHLESLSPLGFDLSWYTRDLPVFMLIVCLRSVGNIEVVFGPRFFTTRRSSFVVFRIIRILVPIPPLLVC